jgi:serine/threonine protein kinase
MEYIDGPDLEDLLKTPHEAIFTIKEIIKLADQLANALSHCHKVSVKHGDIKSNNVKFNIHTGNYVLLDFGLSAMSDDQRRTSIRHAGAIEFMAPEQNEGLMYFQTDVYSYGIILYELIAGQVPFPLNDNGETSRNAVMLAHMEKEGPDVMELRKKNLPESWSDQKKEHEMLVPEWLLQVVSKCLQKDPDNRYQNGIELQDVLVHSSIAAVKSNQVDDSWNASVLLKENERLQGLLLYYQEAESARGVHVVNNPSETPVVIGKQGVRIAKPIFVTLIILLVALSGFASFVMIKHSRGIYNTFFKSTPPTRDTLSKASQPAATDTAKTKPEEPKNIDNGNAASDIPPEVDSLSDSILRGLKHKRTDPQFYRDSVKAADTSKLSF